MSTDATELPPTSTISDALGRLNAFDAALRPRTPGKLAGPAFCIEVHPGDSATAHLAIEHAPAGSVLVIAAGGFPDRAVWGEILTAAAQRRGVSGALVDGAIRDVDAIRARGFPIFSTSVTPTGPHKAAGGRWGHTVACAGAVVATGDMIVTDEDGAVVIPADRYGATLDAARAIVQREQTLLEQIARGDSTVDLLGLSRPAQTPSRGEQHAEQGVNE